MSSEFYQSQPVFLFHGIDLWFCGWPWSPLEEGDEGCIGPIGKLLCISKTKNIMQYMHGNIPYNTFDCCANQVVHLLLLKSSIGQCKVIWTRQHNIRQVKKANRCVSTIRLVDQISNNQRLMGVPPQLSEFVCAFHPATPGSNPKHTIYAFINLNLNCIMLKRGRDWPVFKNHWRFEYPCLCNLVNVPTYVYVILLNSFSVVIATT